MGSKKSICIPLCIYSASMLRLGDDINFGQNTEKGKNTRYEGENVVKEFFKKNWWIFVAAEVLILGVLTFLCFHKDRTIVDAPLDKWDSWVIDYNGDSWYLDETIVKEKLGESKSVDMIYGPYIDMKKGSYTVTIQYEACLLYTSPSPRDRG